MGGRARNLEPLCEDHHIGSHGIHVLPGPIWEPQRFWKDGLPVPAVRITAQQLNTNPAIPIGEMLQADDQPPGGI